MAPPTPRRRTLRRPLKRQPGRNLLIYGSAGLVRTLLQHNLIDDYRLMFYPLVLGQGKRLFEQVDAPKTLKLVETRAFDSGIVVLTYQPAQGAWLSPRSAAWRWGTGVHPA